MNLIPWRRKRETSEQREQSETSLAGLRHDVDSLFDRFLRDPWCDFDSSLRELARMPLMDLADAESEVTVTMELPGVDPKEVDISITGDVLTVRGEKKTEKKEKTKDCRYVERQQGSFHRSVRLPGSVDPSKVEATFKNGILSINVAKDPDAKPKRITVRNA